MNVQARIVLCVIAGVLAGLLTWFVSDVSGLVRVPDAVRPLTEAEGRQQQMLCMVFGGLVGALLGAVDGLLSGSGARTGRAAGVGLLVGVVSGAIGLLLGQWFFGALYQARPAGPLGPLAFLVNVLARALGWGFIGALTGTAEGWRKRSFRVGRNGFLGGFIGGVLGGTTFEIVPYLLPGLARPGVAARLAGFTITGAAIGLFVALVQEWFKEAWVRVLVGRNEGKEYRIDTAETRIGRSELSDIPLFGDPSVARTHALLVAGPEGRYTVRDVSETPAGVLVNGARIDGRGGDNGVPVRDGDRIQIGGRTLVFHERLTRQRTAMPPRDAAAAAAARSGGAAVAPPFPAVNGGPRLVATSGPHAGAAFALGLGGEPLAIGRDPAHGVALPSDAQASRLHARVRRDADGRFVIEDAGSTNGTFVNGHRLDRPEVLVPGDTVQVGSTALRFEEAPRPAAGAAVQRT